MFIKLLVIFLFLTFSILAQTRSVVIAWNDTSNPTGTTYNIYRAPSACTSTPVFTKLNITVIAVKTHTDNTVQVGQTYCYRATAIVNTTESLSSNLAEATIKPVPPELVTVSP